MEAALRIESGCFDLRVERDNSRSPFDFAQGGLYGMTNKKRVERGRVDG
jgi:hypothetical protein